MKLDCYSFNIKNVWSKYKGELLTVPVTQELFSSITTEMGFDFDGEINNSFDHYLRLQSLFISDQMSLIKLPVSLGFNTEEMISTYQHCASSTDVELNKVAEQIDAYFKGRNGKAFHELLKEDEEGDLLSMPKQLIIDRLFMQLIFIATASISASIESLFPYFIKGVSVPVEKLGNNFISSQIKHAIEKDEKHNVRSSDLCSFKESDLPEPLMNLKIMPNKTLLVLARILKPWMSQMDEIKNTLTRGVFASAAMIYEVEDVIACLGTMTLRGDVKRLDQLINTLIPTVIKTTKSDCRREYYCKISNPAIHYVEGDHLIRDTDEVALSELFLAFLLLYKRKRIRPFKFVMHLWDILGID